MFEFVAVILFAIATSITPGPNNIMILSSGLNFGFRRSLPHLWGISLGFPMMLIAVGMGFHAIFELWPWLHSLIQALGIVYLVYLAYRVATAAPTRLDVSTAKPLNFVQAAAFQWVNPKAWVVAVGAISAYTTSNDYFIYQVLLISAIFVFAALGSVGLWLVGGVYLKRWLSNWKAQRLFNWIMALLLLLSIAPVFVEQIRLYFKILFN